jgi:uncharacterized protein YggE
LALSQESSNSKLYLLIVILSIAVVVLTAGLYAKIVSSNMVGKFPEDKTLSVTGSSWQLVFPDTASINIGVITKATTARDASDKNTQAMKAVINILKNLGIQEKDIQTSTLSIQPDYNYPTDRAPVITGYSASNNVEVTTTMLDKLSDIVDMSVSVGANQINGISFTISEEKQKLIQKELLGKAANDANSRANNLAETLKVKIVSVKTASISEGGFPIAPSQVGQIVAEKTATPILPGESRITVSIQVTYIIE